MIDISRAAAIPGWMKAPELIWLGEQARQAKTIIEIGCYLGRSTRILAENCSGTVYAVDPWSAAWYELNSEVFDLKKYPEPYSLFARNLDGCANVEPIHGTIWHVPDGVRADLLFIDGDHSYDAVTADIAQARSLMKPGGILCGHDYTDPKCPGVKRAVDEAFPTVQIAPETSIWCVRV